MAARRPCKAGHRACAVFALLFSHLATGTLPAATPMLTSLSPRGFECGKEVDLTLSGSDLQPGTLWTSCGIANSLVEASENSLRCRITIPGSLPVGLYAARLFSSNGVSNLVPFMVDDLPTIVATATNENRASAQVVPFPCAVEGTAAELGYTWFKIHAARGQRIALETVAARLGSRLDAVLRVVDGRGREVAYNDDAPGLRADSYVSFVAAAGDYFIELRDVNYGGGTEFYYRLRIGNFPLATTTYPVAATRGTRARFELDGPGGAAGECKPVIATNALTIPLASAGAQGSAFAQALATPMIEMLEQEPNDTPETATHIPIPSAVNGRFQKKRDRDFYEFHVSKGEKLAFQAQTRSVGAPCDLVMELESTNGNRLAGSNPGGPDEGTLTHAFMEPATCRLVVSEANGAGGPALNYRIAIAPVTGFTLSVESDAVQQDTNGAFDLKVSCARSGYKDAITLSIDGLGALSLSNNVIAAGKTNVTLKAQPAGAGIAGIPRHFSVFGAAKDGSPRVRASTGAALRKVWPQLLYPPPEFDGIIALGVPQHRGANN